MNHFIRSVIVLCTGVLLLGFYSSWAQQYPPIKPVHYLTHEISSSTTGVADEIPHTFAEDVDGTLYVAGAYDYSSFLGRYNPSSPTGFAWLIKLDGGMGYEGIKHIFLGADNTVNVITTNIYSTTDLDPGPGTTKIANSFDIIWIKYSKDGSFISARKLTETLGNPYKGLYQVANDAAGNVYIYGGVYGDEQHAGRNDLDNGTGSFFVSDKSYLVKYNASGGFVWAKTFAKNVSWEIQDIKVTGDAVYLGGNFWGTTDFDFDLGVQSLTPASRDAFLARYSAATGSYTWAFNVGGTDSDGIEEMLIRNDAIVVCGVYTYMGNDGVDFDPSPQGTHMLKGALNGGQLFTATYSFNKELRSAVRLTENAKNFYDEGFRIRSFAMDAQGQYFIGGSLSGVNLSSWDVDPSENQFPLQLKTGNASTGFILKYANNGALAWGSAYYQSGGWYSQLGHFFPSKAPGGHLAVIGMFQGMTNIDPVSGGMYLVGSRYDATNQKHYREMFVAYYCEVTRIPTPVPAWPRYIKPGTSATFRINPVAGATGYTWSFPNGFTITSGNNTTQVVVTAGAFARSGDIAVRAVNGCGASAAYRFAITVGTKDAATITQENIVKAYGDAPFTLQASSNSTGAITYEVINNPGNAITLTGNTVTINRLGEAVLAARVTGDANYGDGLKEFTIRVDKRQLIAKADSYTRLTGQANPPFKISYTGFIAGEDASRLDVAPVAATQATASSPAGVYPITVSGGSDDHYSFLYENGTLTVIAKTPATITLSNLTQTYSGGVIQPAFVTQPQGLSVRLLYNGSDLPPVNAGTYIVDAVIESDTYEGRTIDTLIIEKAQQVITLGSLPELYADGSTVSLPAQASSGLPVELAATPSYLVSIQGTTVTPLAAGEILLTFSQAGNNNYRAAEIKQVSACIKPQKPEITITSGRPEYSELTSSARINNQWYKDNMLIPGAVDQTLFVMESGMYQVKVTVNGCENISEPLSIWIGENESFSASSYPNPAIETVTVNISSPAADASITIFNDKGLKVLEVPRAQEKNELQLNHLPPGMYHLVLWDGRQKKVERLLKK